MRTKLLSETVIASMKTGYGSEVRNQKSQIREA